MYPNLEETTKILEEFSNAPVFSELLIDSCTPVNVIKALKNTSENCFILESVDNSNQWGRFSFIGINPKGELIVKDGIASFTMGENVRKSTNPAQLISEIMEENRSPSFPNQPKLTGGLIGYFGYDMIRYFEKKLANSPADDIDMADCNLFLYDEIVAFDHLSNKAVIILNIKNGDINSQYKKCEERAAEISRILKNVNYPDVEKQNTLEINIKSNISKEKYIENVEKAKKYILNGDIFQVVLSQRLEVENPPDAFDVYRMLRATNPSPYLYYFQNKGYQIAGASPEMLVNVTKDIVTTKPIAGTIQRGKDENEDKIFQDKLLNDDKERAEHTMLVDLGRNDMGKIAKFGTVEVTSFMQVEKYSKVMHLVSDVKGILRDEKMPLDALLALLPAGTLSGAPKIRAMEIIDELEVSKRGLYGGTVGYLGFDGSIDTCIAIRTVLFKNGKAFVQAGAGIVADSIAEKEFQETENKALAVINAIKEAAKL